MADRREDVEELLRLKTNPFPDGTLEAPEFPRRVYASNVVQPVNAQLVAQSKTGPRLLQADESGVMQVTIPDAARPIRDVYDSAIGPVQDLQSQTYWTQTWTPPDRSIISIRSINLTSDMVSGATQGSVDFYVASPSTGSSLLIASWPYSTKPSIQCSMPMGSGVVLYPGPEEAWVTVMNGLRFSVDRPVVYYLWNRTNGVLPSHNFAITILYYVEFF
jgi:hypothetical protein